MTPFSEPALILTDGGLAGLLACFIEGVCRSAGRVAPTPPTSRSAQAPPTSAPLSKTTLCLALPPHLEPQRAQRLAAARHAAEITHLAEVIEISPVPFEHDTKLREQGLGESALLMAAGSEALRRGLARVVWPVQVGGPGGDGHQGSGGAGQHLDSIADAFDRAMVCARLLSIDAGPDGLAIQTPFVDFTDAQLADLAADLDLPIEAAYFDPSEDEQRRWSAALGLAGLAMPAPGSLVQVVRPDARRLRAM